MWSVLINVLYALEKKVYSAIAGYVHKVKSVGSAFEILYVTDFPCLYSMTYWEKSVEICLWLWICLFFLQFYYFLLHVLWSVVIRWITIEDCYVTLMNWPLYHHKMNSFIPGIGFVLISILSDISIATAAFSWFVLVWYTFSILLLLIFFSLYI